MIRIERVFEAYTKTDNGLIRLSENIDRNKSPTLQFYHEMMYGRQVIFMADALIDIDYNYDYVIGKIDDWENRLKMLWGNIKEWAGERPEWQLEEVNRIQRNEYPMKIHEIPPRSFPTLNFYNKSRRVSIVPSAIWIVGANGRVNIITNSRLYILVDKGGENGNPSDWQYTKPDKKPNTQPFNKEDFLKILDDN